MARHPERPDGPVAEEVEHAVERARRIRVEGQLVERALAPQRSVDDRLYHAYLHMEWNDLQLFLAVADGGSLTAAARKLRVTQPTASRRCDDFLVQLRAAMAGLGAIFLGKVRHRFSLEHPLVELPLPLPPRRGSLHPVCTRSALQVRVRAVAELIAREISSVRKHRGRA